MKKSPLLIALIATLLLAPGTHADITYQLIDGAGGDQNGHTLSGYITVDSVCGTSCTASNITDFSFTVTGPNNYSYSYQPSTNNDVQISGSALNVAADGIYFDFDHAGYAEFSLRDGTWVGPQLIWQSDADLYRGFVSYNFGSSVKAWDNNSPASGVVKIASVVPEPTSLALLGLGGLLVSPRRRYHQH